MIVFNVSEGAMVLIAAVVIYLLAIAWCKTDEFLQKRRKRK